MTLSNPKWGGVDVSYAARNWIQTPANDANVRRCNISQSITEIADAINHLYGQHPRQIFSQCQPVNVALNTTGKTPCYEWVYNDNFEGAGATSQTLHIISIPRIWANVSNSNSYATWHNYPAFNSGYYNANIANWSTYNTVFYSRITRSRSMISNAINTDGVSTYNGFVVLDVVAEDDPMTILASNVHRYADVSLSHGAAIVSDAVESCRDSLHHARTCGLPVVFGWAATGQTALPVTRDCTGINVASNALLNLLDGTSNVRNASTPGPVCPVYLSGVGLESNIMGQNVKCAVRVLAQNPTNNATMTIRFQGPNHVANNYVDINIAGNSAANAAWYGTVNSFIYLNANCADYGAVGAERNKVDIFGQTNAGAGYVYGLRGWLEYG